MKIVVVVLFLMVSSVFGQAQTGQNQTHQIAFTRVERIGEATGRSFFIFSTRERNFAIRHDGHGEGSSTTALRRNFDLKMEGAVRLEQVYFGEYEGDLLLEYEVTDQKSAWGYILRMDQKTMKVRWITSLNWSGLEPALVAGSEIHLHASTVLFKIDLRNGSIVRQ